jgi:TonB-dependent SusC/RagA subfamily outer membrane receptor
MTSSAIFIYVLKSIALSGICFGYYTVFLKNTLLHQYNRFYLLATLLISLVGPFIQLDFLQVNEDQVSGIGQTMIYLNEIQRTPEVQQTDWNFIALSFSAGISTLLIAYLAFGIIKIYQIKRTHQVKSSDGIVIIETDLENAPFSFLNLLFWKKSIDLSSEHGQKIFQHELAHIRQKHSYDRLFCQLIASIAWFNPFHWLIQKELQNIHEFIADREAIQHGDVQTFAKMMLQSHYGNEFLNPSHSFYYSSLKRRIMLLTTSKKPKYVYFRKVSVLPILAAAMALFSIQVNAQEKKPKKQKGTTYMVTMKSDSTTFTDPKTGKKVFSVATKDMPPPPAPANAPTPPTPPKGIQHLAVFVDAIALDSNTFEFKNKKNGTTFMATRVANGSGPSGKPMQIKVDSVSFVSVPTDKIKPLIVVNGTIMKDLDLNKINPNAIESINVLKGAKALAKYADQGANGVVEITTKK